FNASAKEVAMTASHFRVALSLLLVVLVWSCPALPVPACLFCIPWVETRGPTLLSDFEQADLVLVGTFENARPGAVPGDKGTADFRIHQVLKAHEVVKGKMVITVPRFVEPKCKFVLFCEIHKGTIAPYRGEELQTGTAEVLRYLRGAIMLKDAPPGQR